MHKMTANAFITINFLVERV